MRGNRASRAPKFSLDLCNLVATSNEPLGFFSSPSFAAAGELATFDLAAIVRAMAQHLCIRNEVSGSVSDVAVALLVSISETEQAFVHLTADCSTSDRNSLLLPLWPPCPSLPAPPSHPKIPGAGCPAWLLPCTKSGAFWVMLHQAVTVAWSRLECLASSLKHIRCF